LVTNLFGYKEKNVGNMEDLNKITPMMKQYLEVKEQHPDKIILFRMGDFYETFYEDAQTSAKVLGITLTSRNKNDDDKIPLAGFPYHALDNYLDKFVKSGLKVVICEQIEDPKLAKGLVKRDIVQIITPGTIIDEKFIESFDNNYLAAMYKHQKFKKIGFSFIDISTGDFIFTEINKEQILSEISRISPSEIIFADDDLRKEVSALNIDNKPVLTLYNDSFFDIDEAKKSLLNHFKTTTLEGFGATGKPLGVVAAGLILIYLKSLRNDNLKHVSSLRSYSTNDFMQIDEVSRRNLELLRSMRYNTRFGSLISVIDETQTPMGARLLKEWLTHPLVSIADIRERSDTVNIFRDSIASLNEIRTILAKIGDMSRIISKVGALRVNARDLIALSSYLATAPEIDNALKYFEHPLIENIRKKIINYDEIVTLIDRAIIENPPHTLTEGGIISDGFNHELDELRNISREGKSWIARLEKEEKERSGIPSLKIGYNKVFGYYIEITKTYADKAPSSYIRKQTLVNCERYISPELKEYEAKVLGAEERIKNIEYELFCQIRNGLYEKVELLQQYVQIIALLDVQTNLAHIAYQRNYVKPEFNNSGIISVRDSRHPVIERLLTGEDYIPNDIEMDNVNNIIHLITGPNMAGKSTYLRQVGLLVILAQMGSYIPASYANFPIFDKVFTRVGASDNLAMGQSTFLVEMIETANILNSATNDSLILLDEIGRGTSTFDGLSLAWSIVEYIHNTKNIRTKTLFATHYHELTELEEILPGVKNYNIAVQEWNDQMIFIRKIRRGSADQSYGIQVARLAGIPQKVITRAKAILKNLEDHELSPQGLSAQARKENMKEKTQLDIFDVLFEESNKYENIIEDIKNVDLNNVTPFQALELLHDLKKKL